MLFRSDVDTEKIVILGVSQGGFWVPRALAFEHRIAAAVADPGVVDVGASWTAHMPPGTMQGLLDAPEAERAKVAAEIDQGVAEGMAQSIDFRFTVMMRMNPYGVAKMSEMLVELAKYTLTNDVITQITTPLLIADPEGEQFWPGQSRQLYDALPGPKALLSFTAAEGADLHCQPKANGLASQRFFDGMARYLEAPTGTPAP